MHFKHNIALQFYSVTLITRIKESKYYTSVNKKYLFIKQYLKVNLEFDNNYFILSFIMSWCYDVTKI